MKLSRYFWLASVVFLSAFSGLPSSEYAYECHHASRSIKVIDPVTRLVVDTIPLRQAPKGIVSSSDSQFIYVSDTEGYINVIDKETNQVTARVLVTSTLLSAIGMFLQ